MNVVVYADESGTHDETGVLKGAREATVGGYIKVLRCRFFNCRVRHFTTNLWAASYAGAQHLSHRFWLLPVSTRKRCACARWRALSKYEYLKINLEFLR